MAIIIHDRDISTLKMPENQLRLEIALFLYAKGNVSMGRASKFAGISRLEFQKTLGEREINVNYDEEAFLDDLRAIGI